MSDLFKYVIREITRDGVKDIAPVEILAYNTKNTWQHDRDQDEKISDTLYGKIAEEILHQYMLKELNDELGYIPYDFLRKDNYKKHAPFDALLFKKNLVSIDVVEKCIDLINGEILDENNLYGTISPSLRNYCFNLGVYTVEVKSTKVNESKLGTVRNLEVNTPEYYSCLIDSILEDDFLAYPHFCRDNCYIRTFDDYLYYVKKYRLKTEMSDLSIIPYILKKELDYSSDIFVRVYMLSASKGIIIGYTTKYDLFLKCNIGRCPSKKSKNAIYYKQNLKEGKSIKSLCDDLILWS